MKIKQGNKTNKKVGVAGISEVGLPKIKKLAIAGLVFGAVFAAAWMVLPIHGAEAASISK